LVKGDDIAITGQIVSVASRKELFRKTVSGKADKVIDLQKRLSAELLSWFTKRSVDDILPTLPIWTKSIPAIRALYKGMDLYDRGRYAEGWLEFRQASRADAGYIESTIRGGLSGEIDVNGQIYDSVMPAQSALSDEDIMDVIAYIQSGFATPSAPVTEIITDDSGGGGLPTGVVVGFYIALLAGAVLAAPRIIGVNDRRDISWTDAWLKTSVIVVVLIGVTTVLPARVIEADALRDLSRNARDLITVGVWSVGYGAALFGLWYAHRKNRI
jgi:hypothetical protein